MEIFERIVELRKSLKMNQGDFAASLGFAQSTVAMIEVGKRAISDRHIKTICSVYNVNEDWLINGTEPMYKEQKEDYIEKLAEKYNGDSLFKNIISAFIKLEDSEKAAVLKFIDTLEPDTTAVKFAASSDNDETQGTLHLSDEKLSAIEEAKSVSEDDLT